MTIPVDGSRVFHGFVQSLKERSDSAPGAAECMCWFDDHSIQLVAEDTLRLCAESMSASETIEAVTPAAMLVIAGRHRNVPTRLLSENSGRPPGAWQWVVETPIRKKQSKHNISPEIHLV
jgi:hypothetical protein